MIDVFSEQLIDLHAACRLPPFRNVQTGKPAHISSMYRNILRGAVGACGERIKLETVRTPGGIRTSLEAVQRFCNELTHPDHWRSTTKSRTPPTVKSLRASPG